MAEKSALRAELETTKERLEDVTTKLRASQACEPQPAVSIPSQLTRRRQPQQQQAGKRKRQASQVSGVMSTGDAVNISGSGSGRPPKKTKRELAYEKEVTDALKTLHVPAYGVPVVETAAGKFLERLRRLAGLLQRRDSGWENAAKELCWAVSSLAALIRLKGTSHARVGLTRQDPAAGSELALHRSVMVILRFYAMLCACGDESTTPQDGVAATMGQAMVAAPVTTTPMTTTATMTGAILGLFRDLLVTLEESLVMAVDRQVTNLCAHLLNTFLITLAALDASRSSTGVEQAIGTTHIPAALHVSILHAMLQRLGTLTHTGVYGHGAPPSSLHGFLSTPLPVRATETAAMRMARARADAEARLLLPALRLALAAAALLAGSTASVEGVLEAEMGTVRRTLWKGVFGDLMGTGQGEMLLQPPAYAAPVEEVEGEGAIAEGEQWVVARMWELFGWEDTLGAK